MVPSSDLALADPFTCRLVLMRPRRNEASGQAARCVHLVPLPSGSELAAAVGTLCGTLLPFEQVETVAPSAGPRCSRCVLHSEDTPRPAVRSGYQEWGWPMAVGADGVLLVLGGNMTALALPAWLADAVIPILTARDRPPAVLTHPGAPEHRVLLAGEPFGASLPWPAGVHAISGALPLPPTATMLGSVRWLQPPHHPGLATCREIDVFAAVRTALRDVAQVEGGCS